MFLNGRINIIQKTMLAEDVGGCLCWRWGMGTMVTKKEVPVLLTLPEMLGKGSGARRSWPGRA